ncbi:response regulator transcription factor [Ilumatobacter coccineus]|uniref:Putative OmpR family two-component response regulator n=1 Tax=Ilumatobacter coccineus (strain NBRC 103263 / KCTC 29153 / YM16-304) TaxID=1313172 RepID=A0A6C7EEC8_ILUCY|nr:response regulator transcription factor [Ilumatobacter coccineus]BAN03529.1 putative OmpR family two-component response regulator [Ilumatobacter coccineus YM16-304]
MNASAAPSPTVLVVDDDPGVRETLRMALSYEGYDVRLAGNGGEGLEYLAEQTADAVIVDVMMPHVDGLSMCRALRRRRNRVPILVLTARSSIGDRVEGLDAGADDYLVKPFSLDELLARVRALIRRSHHADAPEPTDVGDLVLDPRTRSARRGERRIELTKTEYELLAMLMAHPGAVLTREVIYDRIWGCDLSATSRSLDVYVSYLRQKTEADGEPRMIQTVRGIGFMIESAERST